MLPRAYSEGGHMNTLARSHVWGLNLALILEKSQGALHTPGYCRGRKPKILTSLEEWTKDLWLRIPIHYRTTIEDKPVHLLSSSSKQLDLKYPEIGYCINQKDSSPFCLFLFCFGPSLKECFFKSDLPVKLHIPTTSTSSLQHFIEL